MSKWNEKKDENKTGDFTFEIVNHFCSMENYQDKDGNDWTIELNEVSFNGKESRFDIRPWNPDHTRMGKGIRFGAESMDALEKFFRS